MKVYDSLRYGRENTVPSKILAKALGFQSVRDLQKQIERERATRAVILSDPCGAFTRKGKKSTLRAAESAQRALDAVTGQERTEGWWQ